MNFPHRYHHPTFKPKFPLSRITCVLMTQSLKESTGYIVSSEGTCSHYPLFFFLFLALFFHSWRLFSYIAFILGPFSLLVDTMTWIPHRSVPKIANCTGDCIYQPDGVVDSGSSCEKEKRNRTKRRDGSTRKEKNRTLKSYVRARTSIVSVLK